MKQSFLFTKTQKEAPKDEVSANAQLLARAGFIDKLAAGIYTFLPIGLAVLKKIENIIREEMVKINGQEILMPALQPKENWLKTGRWDGFDVLFKTEGKENRQYALGATHEEIIVPLVQKHISSYKDLPFYAFQIQDKFRDEPRAKSGLLRTREFLMKDLYSFHATQKDLDKYYEIANDAYFKIFEHCGIKDKTYLTLASGGTFSKYSHEFQVITEAGEDTIHICQKCNLAVNAEVKNETPACPDCNGTDFKKAKAIEVGNIFKLGTKYSEPFDLKYKDEKGKEHLIIMGCYGIGLGRLMGTIAEICHDEKGLIWPSQVAPFQAHLIVLDGGEKTERQAMPGAEPRTVPRSGSGTREAADELYKKLTADGIEILYDDREVSAGEKFADADLIGIPVRLVISEKTLAQDSIEIKHRNEKEPKLVKISELSTSLL